ncbi:HAD family hydrolase [Bernardetia sp. Wsw4-3y2]|uniref:HAD family hydrolase n=1 Tax=Bernardetia sp. Wsw4-3y2 TaxID=3127471 RepID=UPI0030CAE874
MPYNYIFFDVANTLLQKPQLFAKIHQVLVEHGYEIDIHYLKRIHKLLSETIIFPDKTSKEFYHHFNTELLYAVGILPNFKLLEDIFAACTYMEWQPFDDTDFLNQITIPTGIISNWDISLESKLKSYFNCDFFAIYGSQKEGLKKPSLDFYKKAIEKLECSPNEILYVGDSIKLDTEPARKLGIEAILVDRENVFPYYKEPKINSLHQLSTFLD